MKIKRWSYYYFLALFYFLSGRLTVFAQDVIPADPTANDSILNKISRYFELHRTDISYSLVFIFVGIVAFIIIYMSLKASIAPSKLLGWLYIGFLAYMIASVLIIFGISGHIASVGYFLLLCAFIFLVVVMATQLLR